MDRYVDLRHKLLRCSLGCAKFGQCKAAMHSVPSECAAGALASDIGRGGGEACSSEPTGWLQWRDGEWTYHHNTLYTVHAPKDVAVRIALYALPLPAAAPKSGDRYVDLRHKRQLMKAGRAALTLLLMVPWVVLGVTQLCGLTDAQAAKQMAQCWVFSTPLLILLAFLAGHWCGEADAALEFEGL